MSASDIYADALPAPHPSHTQAEEPANSDECIPPCFPRGLSRSRYSGAKHRFEAIVARKPHKHIRANPLAMFLNGDDGS